MPKRKTEPLPSRFAPPMRRYLEQLMEGNTQVEVADAMGFGQNTLSEQLSGKRPATLEMVDKVSRYFNKSVSQVLTGLRDAALEMDQATPGWDKIGPTAPPDVADRVQFTPVPSQAKARSGRKESSPASAAGETSKRQRTHQR